MRHIYALIIDTDEYTAIPKVLSDVAHDITGDCAVRSVQLVVMVPTSDDERVPRLALVDE